MAEISTYKDMSARSLQQKIDALSAKYPHYEDFDVFRTRSYILYPDALGFRTFEDLERYYSDIYFFQALMIARDPKWKWFQSASAKEFNHLSEYVQSLQDTKLCLAMDYCVGEFYRRDAAIDCTYETNSFVVKRISHFAENRLGIFFKDTKEYAIYGAYVSDRVLPDGSPKVYYSYFRSDERFHSEVSLDILHGVADWRRFPSGRSYPA